ARPSIWTRFATRTSPSALFQLPLCFFIDLADGDDVLLIRQHPALARPPVRLLARIVRRQPELAPPCTAPPCPCCAPWPATTPAWPAPALRRSRTAGPSHPRRALRARPSARR